MTTTSAAPSSAAASPPSIGQPADAGQPTSLARDVFGTYGTRALTIALGTIMGVITARILGPHNRGVFSLVYLLPSTVVTFGKLGLAQASVYSLRREKVAAQRVVANAFVASIVLGLLFVTAVFLGRHYLLASVLHDVPEWA